MQPKISRSSCTSILVGRLATNDGSVLIGRNEDSQTAWPKHLQFNPRQEQANQIFRSKANKFTLALPNLSYQYSAMPEWTDRYGVFAEGGINEYHVAMSATESAYGNERALAFDPFDQTKGLLEEAMITIVLPYVKTAREGVQRLGRIIDEHGSAEANGVLFADQTEAWYFEVATGHQWVAQRIPDDAYAVVANQISIEVIDFNDPDHFMTAPNLQSFVQEHHLWPAEQPFNFRRIFGTNDDSDLVYNTPRVWQGQRLLTPSIPQEPQSYELPFIQRPDYPITVGDTQRVLSDHFNGTPYDLMGATPVTKRFRPISVATTQESHVLQLRPNVAADLVGVHWLAMGVSAQSVYVPFYSQGHSVPLMYQRGKADYSPSSAYWVFKHAGVLVDRDHFRFARDLSQTQDQVTTQLWQQLAKNDQAYPELSSHDEQQILIDQHNAQVAKIALTGYQALISRLITKQTQNSPLNFKVDPNL